MRKIIFIGGKAPVNIKKYINRIEETDSIIAADSGYLTAKKMGIIPDTVLGDFDSCDYNSIDTAVKKIMYPKDKDYSDAELALEYNDHRGPAENIYIIGGGEGRLDHSLALISAVHTFTEKNYYSNVLWFTAHECIVFMKNKKIYIDAEIGTNISLFPVYEETCFNSSRSESDRSENENITVSASGLKWKIEDVHFFKGAYSLSNSISNKNCNLDIRGITLQVIISLTGLKSVKIVIDG